MYLEIAPSKEMSLRSRDRNRSISREKKGDRGENVRVQFRCGQADTGGLDLDRRKSLDLTPAFER
jgi:hypothetical protein